MRTITAMFMSLVFVTTAQAAGNDLGNGLITKKSQHSVSITLDRLEKILKDKGMTIVIRWDHAKGAKKAALPLRPTQLLIFGNPKLGTHFMTSSQIAGIDLPVKALAWEDEKGQVWLGYNDPQYVVDRHAIKDRPKIVKKMQAALKKFTDEASGP